jgi:hypothetical protein
MLCVVTSGLSFPFDYAFIEKKLAQPCANQVEFQRVCDTPIVYRASGIWNIPYPMSAVAAVALDFKNYPRVFRYVYRCEQITTPARYIRPLGTWYVEGRAEFARVWAIGNIDSLCRPDSNHLRLIASQNQHPLLEKQWSYRQPGWLNYRTYGVRLATFIVSSGHDSCRIGVVAQGWVRKPMPEWLVRMAAAIILPQLMKDLEREVRKRTAVRREEKSPWFRKWYHSVQKLIF